MMFEKLKLNVLLAGKQKNQRIEGRKQVMGQKYTSRILKETLTSGAEECHLPASPTSMWMVISTSSTFVPASTLDEPGSM